MEDVYDDELCMYLDGEPIDADEDVNDGVECLHCMAIFTPSYYCQEFCDMCDEVLTEQDKEEIRNGK